MAAFYVVYIKEAHAADGIRPVPIPGEEDVYLARSLYERKAVAKNCAVKLSLKLPCLVDDMDNAVGTAYGARPDRIFVVDKDGKIAVGSDRGPWGFKPGLDETAKWLAQQFPSRTDNQRQSP